jgi:hypothetical protein
MANEKEIFERLQEIATKSNLDIPDIHDMKSLALDMKSLALGIIHCLKKVNDLERTSQRK